MQATALPRLMPTFGVLRTDTKRMKASNFFFTFLLGSISLTFRRLIRSLLVIVVSMSLSDPKAFAEDSAKAMKQLESRLKGKTCVLRHIVSNSKVRYDEAGNLTGNWQPGRWTWHGHAEVTRIDLKDGVLKVNANRVLLRYKKLDHRFLPIRGSEKVEIEIQTSKAGGKSLDLVKEWRKAFLTTGESFPENLEPYWRPFIECLKKPKSEECEFYEQKALESYVYRVGKVPNLTIPKIRSRVEPVYTPVARQAGLTGTVIFSAVIDKEGRLRIIRIIQPVGLGLEEGAAEALRKWSFEPGYRQGEAVDVALTIEVNFDLRYSN